MKKNILVLPALALFLSGCTKLSAEDRALLVESRQESHEAKIQATKAAQDSAIARQNAEQAAMNAQRSSEKADRIFQHGGDK